MTALKIALILVAILFVRAFIGFSSFDYAIRVSLWIMMYWGILKITDKVK